MVKPSKDRLIFGVFLLILIVIIELILHQFHLPAWPAFLVMIFFFETHMNPKTAPNIIIGGIAGICSYLLTVMFVGAFAASIGLMVARLTAICVIVYAIIVFGESIPMVFNNYAFMFYLISGLAATVKEPAPNPYLWMGIVLIAGTLIIFSVIGIGKLMAMMFGPAPAAPPEEH